jgi:hypothetical protein
MIEVCHRCGTKRNAAVSKVGSVCYGDKLNDSPKARRVWRKYKRLQSDPSLIKSVRRSRLKYELKHKDDPEYRARKQLQQNISRQKRLRNPALKEILNQKRRAYYITHRERMLVLQSANSKRYRARKRKLALSSPIPLS